MAHQQRDEEPTNLFSSPEMAEVWQRGAAARAEWFAAATELMLDLAGVVEGSRVLDVAAGTGEQTLVAARRVGPTGSVLATDVSAPMLLGADEAARTAGLGNVETRVVDARQLDLEADSFDAAISRLGIMLIPDRELAMQGIRHALRPGAKLAALVFAVAAKNPATTIPIEVVRRVGNLPPPEPGRPGMFALGAPGALDEVFGAAGFRDVAVRAVSIPRRFPSLSAAMQYVREAPFLRELLPQLSAAERERAWSEIERQFRQFETADGFVAPGEALVGVGTK